jgi:hypothetical protein
VQLALELLSDDDDSNDINALSKLLFAFIPFGDIKNATTALAMMAPAEHNGDDENSRDKGEREWGKGHFKQFFARCDGDCDHIWRTPGDMWLCKDCIDVTLTSDCREKVRSGEYFRNICHPNHEHLYIPKLDPQRMKNLPRGYVPWGDENITMEQWREEIQKEYLGKH